MTKEEATAPEGFVWQCGACLRRAKNKMDGGIDQGWDSSCYTNSSLVPADEADRNFVAQWGRSQENK
jgi:hypothetical protein